MPGARVRRFAVPASTERAALFAIGLWAVAYSFTRLLEAVNTTGALLLDAVPSGPNTWRPAQLLGDIPFVLQRPLVMIAPLVLVAFVAWGLAMWPDRARRTRFLLAFAFVDALIVILAYQGLTSGQARSNAAIYALSQASTAPFVAIGVLMAWPAHRARVLALTGIAVLALCYAAIHWMDLGFPAGHWLTEPRAFAAFSIARAFAWASVPGLFGTALLIASRATTPRLPSDLRTGGSAPPSHDAR